MKESWEGQVMGDPKALVSALLCAWLTFSLASPPSLTPVSASPEMGSWIIKRCNPWRCTDAGSTCGGPPFCYGDHTPYQCLSRFNVTKCSRLCRYEDILGRRLGDPFYEEERRQRHAGCCNICNTLRYPPEAKAKPTLRLSLTPPLAPSTPSSSWFLPILARECDEIVHSECRYTLWRNTGFEYCSFSFWCILALPPFSGHFVEQEREQICWTRCKNGYTYTAVYSQRRSLLVGCCGSGLPLKRGGEPYRGLPGRQEEPFRILPEEKR